MRLLVIFAAWARDEEESSRRWLNWYREILDMEFVDDDKIVVVGWDAAANVEDNYNDLSHLIAIQRVNRRFHVNSDAAPFQLALSICMDILAEYDYVLFMHAKGASYPFAEFGWWRQSIVKTVFNRKLIANVVENERPSLVADTGHMIVSTKSIEGIRGLAHILGMDVPTFAFSATRTLYYTPAMVLTEFINRLPETFFMKNLIELGANRYFFEAPVPSVLVMLGARRPIFVGGARFNENLNPCVSYDFDTMHNAAIVMDQYQKRQIDGVNYLQAPVPYIFVSQEDVSKLRVSFEQYCR